MVLSDGAGLVRDCAALDRALMQGESIRDWCAARYAEALEALEELNDEPDDADRAGD